jgi:glycerol uptake facilitator protein
MGTSSKISSRENLERCQKAQGLQPLGFWAFDWTRIQLTAFCARSILAPASVAQSHLGRTPVNDVLGEFLGTMVLILFGDGVVAGVLLSRSKSQNSGWIVITAGWAFAVMSGIYVARAVGGPTVGFINPVGPLAGVLTGALSVEKALMYAGAEFAGAFVGAVIVWLHYWPHWRETSDPGLKLAVFCTGPAIRMPAANVISEVIGTFALVFVASAIVEKAVTEGTPSTFLGAPLVGGLVWGIGLSLGGTTGYAINPARDLGPRIAHALLPIPGKGSSDWSYAWIPVVGPFVGAAIAALLAKAVMLPR